MCVDYVCQWDRLKGIICGLRLANAFVFNTWATGFFSLFAEFTVERLPMVTVERFHSKAISLRCSNALSDKKKTALCPHILSRHHVFLPLTLHHLTCETLVFFTWKDTFVHIALHRQQKAIQFYDRFWYVAKATNKYKSHYYPDRWLNARTQN